MQLCRVSVLELVVSVLKDIGSDVRRVPTSEPVEISVDGVLERLEGCYMITSARHGCSEC